MISLSKLALGLLLLVAPTVAIDYDYVLAWYVTSGIVDFEVCDAENDFLQQMVKLSADKCLMQHGVDPVWQDDTSDRRELCAGSNPNCAGCPPSAHGYCQWAWNCNCRRRRLGERQLESSETASTVDQFAAQVASNPGDIPFANCLKTSCFEAINAVMGMSTTTDSCKELLVRLSCSATVTPSV